MSKNIQIGQYRLVEIDDEKDKEKGKERYVLLIIGKQGTNGIWKAKRVSTSGMERVDFSEQTPSIEISPETALVISLGFAAKKLAGFLEIH